MQAYTPAGPSVTTVVDQPFDQWAVGLCDCCASGCTNCFYSLLCSACAHASARSNADDSDWCFNCLCICTTPVARNIIREGYHIEGSCVGDILCGIFCAPCTSCQVLSETEKRGRQRMQWGPGRSPTEQPFQHGMCDCCSDCGTCLCSFLVPGCAFAKARSNFDGSNCLFNWCCMSPCLLRSVVRDGYNLEGSCTGDMCWPIVCPCCSAAQLLNEVRARGKVNKVYVNVPVQTMKR